jgi:hypothetical protein
MTFLRLPDGSVLKLNAVPRETQSRRQSKTSHGKIKWPSSSTDSPNIIHSIYDEKVVDRPRTRVVSDETGWCKGRQPHDGCSGTSCRKPFVPLPTHRTYSPGRGGAGHMHRKGTE